MNLADRVRSFEMLGDRLRRYHEDSTDPAVFPLLKAAHTASLENPWFTPGNIRIAMNNLGMALIGDNLEHWLTSCDKHLLESVKPRRIGVVMAGNIPAVGFHDLLCVLLAGHKLTAKLSASDDRLLPAIAAMLIDHLPEWQENISFSSGRLENFDAVIATGSNNTSRYFEFYFGRYPHIIRKNRNSVAVLDGSESDLDLQGLADDMMLFFGMGCRSISKLVVPAGFDFSPLFAALEKYREYADHNKYRNNYDYNKSIFLVSQVPFVDTGFLLFIEEKSIAARIALVNYETYRHVDEAISSISENLASIQCVVGKMPYHVISTGFGEAQKPALWDYADQVDTMQFLLTLK